jgi:hypothetical protein
MFGYNWELCRNLLRRTLAVKPFAKVILRRSRNVLESKQTLLLNGFK